MGVNIRQLVDGSLAFWDEATQAIIARLGGPAVAIAAAPQWKMPHFIKTPLAALDTAGGILSVANPFSKQVIVERLILNVTTFTAGACTADFGVGATGATSNDSLIDGINLATAAQIADNISTIGTNGKSRQLWGSSQFITGSMATGAAAGLAGFAYIGVLDL